MENFNLPDPKKGAGKVVIAAMLAGVGLLGYYYLLPFLLTIVWGTVELAVGAIVAGIVGWVLFSKKFWKRLSIIGQALGEMLFSGFIEMNPFVILNLQLDKAEDDRRDLLKQSELLKSEESKLSSQLLDAQDKMRQAAKEMDICKDKMNRNPGDEDTSLQLESSSTDFINNKDFVDSVAPIVTDLQRLITFADKAYRKSGNALKNAKTTLSIQKSKFDAVTHGSNAMKKAMRAFTGDPEMNKAGDIALNKIRTDIAYKVGAIKSSLQVTSQIMNERDLKDAAKIALAADTADKLNIDQTFDYIPPVLPTAIPMSVQGNKYLDQIK